GITNEAIERRARVLRAGDALVDVLFGNRPTAAPCVFAKLPQLHFGILLAVRSGNARIKGDTGSLSCCAHILFFLPETRSCFRAGRMRTSPRRSSRRVAQFQQSVGRPAASVPEAMSSF